MTYTFSTFSTFVDLTAWKIARMPGGYTVDLTSFFGKVQRTDRSAGVVRGVCVPSHLMP